MGAEPPEIDPLQGFDIDDHELDQFIADWEAVDRQAARVLREALGEHRGARIPDGERDASTSRIRKGLAAGVYPFDWIGRAAGLDREAPPDDGTELLLRCVAATISPREETGLDPEEEAMLSSIEHADWIGAIVSAVRAHSSGRHGSIRLLWTFESRDGGLTTPWCGQLTDRVPEPSPRSGWSRADRR